MSKQLANQLAKTIDSLIQQANINPQHVDFSSSYRTRLPGRQVEIVAKHLDHVGEVFLADALRQAYQDFCKAVSAKPFSSTLTDAEERGIWQR